MRPSTITTNGRMLDVGCGDRWVERCLPSNTDYVGLDYPTTISKGYAGKADVFADGQCLPFASNSFDTVILMDVLEHLPAPDLAISEAWRILKPGGILLIQVPFLYPLHDQPHDFQRWSKQGLQVLLTKHFFTLNSMTYQGHALETAAALMAMALAHSVLDSARHKHITLLLAPLLLSAIPVINLRD
jgi:ubiquinone/menaquinone biosynthesis C-methylase UbiE